MVLEIARYTCDSMTSLCLLSQSGWTPLHAAACYCPAAKAMPVAKLLLDAGAAVDARTSVSIPG